MMHVCGDLVWRASAHVQIALGFKALLLEGPGGPEDPNETNSLPARNGWEELGEGAPFPLEACFGKLGGFIAWWVDLHA